MFMYQADLWCDACGEEIVSRVDADGAEDTGDTDDYPQSVSTLDAEGDCPDHCGAGADCLTAEVLADGQRIGALLHHSLTREGVEYVRDAIREGGAVASFWGSEFGIYIKFELRFAAFCGMAWNVEDATEDMEELRDTAARMLRRRRAEGFSVSTLEPGKDWEMIEPEDSFMVPDTAGRLYIREVSG